MPTTQRHPASTPRGMLLAIALSLLAHAYGAAAEPPADHPVLKMPANSWLAIPRTPMRAVAAEAAKFPKAMGICGPAGVINAWSGAALDSRRNRLVLFGGGHGDYGGNELYAFDCSRLAWERLTDPYPEPKDDGSDRNPDGTPQSRHSYGGLAYLAHVDRLFALGGAIFRSGAGSCTKVWTCDFSANNAWQQDADKAPAPTGYDQMCTYDPATGKLWWGGRDGGGWCSLWSYDVATKAWAKKSKTDVTGYSALAMDSKRGRVVVLIGDGKAQLYDVRGTAAMQEVALTGGKGDKCFEVGFEYDPVADRYVRFGLDDTVHVLDPTTWAWTANQPAGAPKGKPYGPFGRWRYVAALNAFVVVTGIDEDVHFYKLTAGAGKK